MTRHTEPDAFAIEMTLRCLPPVDPFVVRWNYPLFELAPDLDPAELRQAPGKNKSQYFVNDLVKQLGNDDLTAKEFQKRCMDETGMSRAVFYRLLEKAAAKKLIAKSAVDGKWEVVKKAKSK